MKDGDAVRPSSIAPFEPADRQRDALAAVLETLDPKVLVLPDRLLDLIPPQAFNRPDGHRRAVHGQDRPGLRPGGRRRDRRGPRRERPAQSPARCRGSSSLTPGTRRLPTSTMWSRRSSRRPGTAPSGEGRAGAVARAVQWLVVTRLISLAGDESADPRVRAVASHALWFLAERMEIRAANGGAAALFYVDTQGWAIVQEIRRFLNRPDATHRRAEPPPSPPGDPIGGEG